MPAKEVVNTGGLAREGKTVDYRDLERPRVLSLTPGRLRLHLPGWSGDEDGRQAIEAALRRLPGVRSVQTNPLTGNVLIHFDPERMTGQTLLAATGDLAQRLGAAPRPAEADGCGKGAAGEGKGKRLVRAGLRGVLGHALVDTVFYALVFAEPFGLPLAGLGALHAGFDVLAWTATLVPVLQELAPGRAESDPVPDTASRPSNYSCQTNSPDATLQSMPKNPAARTPAAV